MVPAWHLAPYMSFRGGDNEPFKGIYERRLREKLFKQDLKIRALVDIRSHSNSNRNPYLSANLTLAVSNFYAFYQVSFDMPGLFLKHPTNFETDNDPEKTIRGRKVRQVTYSSHHVQVVIWSYEWQRAPFSSFSLSTWTDKKRSCWHEG